MSWAALAACAGILAIAWVMTDELGGWVSVPLLMALMASGLLLAKEKAAPAASVIAGTVCAAHAASLLVGERQSVPLLVAYLVCSLVLLANGWSLRRATGSPAASLGS